MRFRSLTLLSLALAVGAPGMALAAPQCQFLPPIGGNGTTPIVTKQVGAPKVTPMGNLFGRTNWNTDFLVDQPYSSYKFFFTADSSDGDAVYPVEGYMKFMDGSNLRVIDTTMSPPIGTGKMFGPFPAIPGKTASQMNFKVGTSSSPGATGFSYRISVQGCR
jgi:hypothetical protein